VRMSKLMVSVSGVRGVYGETLTPDLAMRYAAHFGAYCQETYHKKRIIIGRDSRTTGEAMFHAIVSGLLSVGCDVTDLGIVATPTTLLAVEESEAAGGISITASHNPPEWNAMKFVGGNGMFLFPEAAPDFLGRLEQPIPYTSWDKMGTLSVDNNATRRHIDKVLHIPYLDVKAIREKHYRVVLDSVNGAGHMISPILLQELGCEVIEINAEPTGVFGHVAEPLNENLKQLEEAVALYKADIGFATDPDVDRLSIVSEKGACLGEEYTILLSEQFVLAKQKGDIVVNLSSSMASDDMAARFGVNVFRTKVGEINVGKKMKEIKSPIGGEGNGGVICPEVHYTRDAPAGMALILACMAEANQTVSEIAATIPRYYFAKGKLTVKPEQLDKVMDIAEELYADLPKDKQDGLKILGDKYWIHIRKSGTEPIVRVYVESDGLERSNEICQQAMKDILQKL